MVFSDLKRIAQKHLNAAVVGCCIGIPVYFTDLQRRAVIDAATVAGLHTLRLIHETTATALAYGILKTDLPENDQLNVAFVDVGHASLQVSIAGFKKGQLRILSHSFDRSLGGRDFDEVLFQQFAADFNEGYKIDIFQNAKACLRPLAACEKLKNILCENPKVPSKIECLMDEKDVRGSIKREEFEKISTPILERVKKPLEKALAEAGLTTENIHLVEVFGSGSRVPAIMKILSEFFGKEPCRTMNSSECVARGAALQCAILSPAFKDKEFQVNESFPFPIALALKCSSPDSRNGALDSQQGTIVFPKGNSIPSVKALTIYRSGTFIVDVQYADVSELQARAKISTYKIGPFQASKGKRLEVKVKAHLNLHGIVSVESATLLEEEEIEVPVTKEPLKEPSKIETDGGATADASGSENGVPQSGDKRVQMDTDSKVEAPKKKFKKTNIPVSELVYGGTVAAEMQRAVEKEFQMALQDRVMKETKDKKNALEDYVFKLRNELNDKFSPYVTESEREQIGAKLQEAETWLHRDGEDESKDIYVAKLNELKKLFYPIGQRIRDYFDVSLVLVLLKNMIDGYREDAMSSDPKFDHIDFSDKQKILNECSAAEDWLTEKKQQHDRQPKNASLVLSVKDIKKKIVALDRIGRPIMSKQRPPKPASPSPPQGAEQGVGNPNQNAAPPHADKNAGAGNGPIKGSEPMDTDSRECVRFGSLDCVLFLTN